MAIDLWLCGYCRLCCSKEDATALFEALRQMQITPKALKRDEKNGNITFLCSLRSAAQLRSAFPSLSVTESGRGGLPVIGRRLLLRPGLLCGVVLAVFLMVAARTVLWDVEITGNCTITDDEILHELSELGVYRGRFLPTLDGEEVAIQLRRTDSRIAYASVNLKGTVAFVQIRERVEEPSVLKTPADIVALCDGVVTLPMAYEGECLVRDGDVVRAGQVLISGTINSERHGQRLTRAAGQIWARTTHTYTVRVPFSYEEKRYNGENGTEIYLHFFAFCGKIFKTTGNISYNCDIITNKGSWCFSNGRELPFGFSSTHHLGYELVAATRTAEEALAVARAELDEKLVADNAGRTVLERTVELQADGEGITLICTLVCEEDIAQSRELAAVPNS